MTPIKHPSNNAIAHPPANWDTRGGALAVPALHVTKGRVKDVDVMVSFWQPTKDELALLLAGGKVQLSCLGGQVACNISVTAPHDDVNLILPN